jgi:hypothetical protein
MSVVTTEYNFPKHKRGTTFEAQTLRLEGVDLTGAVILMQFKENNSSAISYEFKTADSSILITNAASGEFELQERILDVPSCTYLYDCLITFPSGKKKVYFEGAHPITARRSS